MGPSASASAATVAAAAASMTARRMQGWKQQQHWTAEDGPEPMESLQAMSLSSATTTAPSPSPQPNFLSQWYSGAAEAALKWWKQQKTLPKHTVPAQQFPAELPSDYRLANQTQLNRYQIGLDSASIALNRQQNERIRYAL